MRKCKCEPTLLEALTSAHRNADDYEVMGRHGCGPMRAFNTTDADGLSWRPYSDAGGGGWQVGCRGHYARGRTKEEASAALKKELGKAGVPLPPGAPG